MQLLAGSGWAGWQATPLAGDASSRRYLRLTGPDRATAILMQTPEPPDGFVQIGAHLSSIGLCPPQVLWQDRAAGLLLIEDLGPCHFAQWLTLHPGDEAALYRAAVEVLAVVQRHPAPPGLPALTPAHAAAMIAPLTDWYAPGVDPVPLIAALEQALTHHAPLANCLSLRDFHAENLIWRPERTGTDRVGLLDFQDAVLAPAEYDLVSLLRDARRDVADKVCEAMIGHFARLTGRDPAQTRAALACLGVQRNLRIIGIFARLAKRDGKSRYLDLLPRVWAHLQRDLSHPAMAEMQGLVLARILPP